LLGLEDAQRIAAYASSPCWPYVFFTKQHNIEHYVNYIAKLRSVSTKNKNITNSLTKTKIKTTK